MTWREIEIYLAEHPDDASVIIPIGPVEEHGPHLGVDTDIATAEAWAVTVQLLHHALRFPSIPLMMCGISADNSGTYAIQQETLRLFTYDLVKNLATKGFRRILFLTGHGGYSLTVVNDAITKVQEETEIEFKAGILNFELAVPEQAQIVGTTDDLDIHSGGIETSRVMGLLSSDQIAGLPAADYHIEFGEKETLSPSGIHGDPRLATLDKGKVIAQRATLYALTWLRSEE